MRESEFSAHQSLEAQALRREALRHAMLNRPSVRAKRESEPPTINPWGRAFTVAFSLVALCALIVVALDLFIFRP